MESIKTPEEGKLKRTLKTRHMVMIAIGGSIGTGLFLASGAAFSSAGPGGALTAYLIMGLMIYFLLMSLGEMATKIPTSGSFETYATRFVDPAMGLALGWNYWFGYAITVAAEMVAGAIIIKFWLPDTSAVAWSLFFLILLFSLNILSTRAYGEAEFWFAGIKVVTVIVFLIVGVLMIIGIMGGTSPGFSNWVLDDGSGNKGPFIGGFGPILLAFLTAGFSFIGTEIIGVTAGESEDPEKNVPKAIRSVFWRILLFYVGAIIVIAFLIPFNEPNLLKTSTEEVAYSPFTIIFSRAGIAGAASIMNAVILTSLLSCGNSSLYVASRMLYAMGRSGKAPRCFSKVNKRGVPFNSVLATASISLVIFIGSFVGDGRLYYGLYNLSALTGFITWFGIALCHYRFRKAYIAQGYSLSDLKFKAPLYPFGPIFAMVLSLVVIFGANYWVFETFNWFDFLTSYGAIIVFAALYYGFKVKHKTKIVPLNECDFSFSLAEENN